MARALRVSSSHQSAATRLEAALSKNYPTFANPFTTLLLKQPFITPAISFYDLSLLLFGSVLTSFADNPIPFFFDAHHHLVLARYYLSNTHDEMVVAVYDTCCNNFLHHLRACANGSRDRWRPTGGVYKVPLC